MKTLLNIETWGIRLYYQTGACRPFKFEWDDTYAPVVHSWNYETREEALGDIVNYLLDPDNIYDMESQPEYLQKAYKLAGVQMETKPVRPEISETVGTFLYFVLDGIARANVGE